MCGRFVGYRPFKELIAHFPIDVADADVTENFNVTSSQEVLSIVRQKDQNHLVRLNWGLVPSWAKDTSMGAKMINARSETAADKPSFRAAFKKRRCLILADGFYEWTGPKGNKQPMLLTLPNGNPFAFAGLWETWDDKGREASYRSCTILTRAASASVRPIHHRMPVILKADAYRAWLDPSFQDKGALQEIIQDQIFTVLTAEPVSGDFHSVHPGRNDNRAPIEQELPFKGKHE